MWQLRPEQSLPHLVEPVEHDDDLPGCGVSDAGRGDTRPRQSQVDVDTNNKVVTLTGDVSTAAAKARAVELARATDGVASAVDNLRVAQDVATDPLTYPAERVMFSDSALTSAVKAKLLADPTVSGLRIDVNTENQTVTLTGEVRSEAEKEKALELARETEGVRSVNDRLTLRR